jgi:hypothetical protein
MSFQFQNQTAAWIRQVCCPFPSFIWRAVAASEKQEGQSRLVHRCANNYTNHLPAFPIAQVKNPQRSPLRLRFLTCTLRKVFCVIDPVICRTMYWLYRFP